MGGSAHVCGAGKRFSRYTERSAPTLKQAMMRAWRGRRTSDRFWALRDISFDVESGTMLGLIGHNGSGKSTLLRLIGDVMRPDAGTIRTEGRLIGLLELNSGLHPELTGRENMLIGGVVAGMSLRETRRSLDEIIDFAELGPFIDNPVRTYSAGMKLRLGFSVAVHAEPGVLLIDEVLAVGDLAFQQKCLDRIRSFKERGAAIVFASHDLGQVTAMCDRVLWLRQGTPVALGDPHTVAGQYRVETAGHMLRHTPKSAPDLVTSGGTVLRTGVNRFGSLEAQITELRLLDRDGKQVTTIESGSALIVEISYCAVEPIESLILGLAIGTRDQEDVVELTTIGDRLSLSASDQQRSVKLELERLDLAPGDYFISPGLYRADWDHAFDYHWHAYPVRVTGPEGAKGLVNPPHRWKLG